MRPWLGSCPECGGAAAFREVETGRVLGACCSRKACWWSGEVNENCVGASYRLMGRDFDGTGKFVVCGEGWLFE